VYCVRAEGGAEVCGGSDVAVKARVGRGVFVGGSGVKLGIRVASSGGTRIPEAGWNGVEVGEAFGSTVTITSVGAGAVTAVGSVQDVDIRIRRRSAKRRDVFINFFVTMSKAIPQLLARLLRIRFDFGTHFTRPPLSAR
jgi:hypothetical protein